MNIYDQPCQKTGRTPSPCRFLKWISSVVDIFGQGHKRQVQIKDHSEQGDNIFLTRIFNNELQWRPWAKLWTADQETSPSPTIKSWSASPTITAPWLPSEPLLHSKQMRREKQFQSERNWGLLEGKEWGGKKAGKSWREDLKFHSSWRFRRTQAALSGCRVPAKHALLSKPCSHPTWPVMSVEQLLYGGGKSRGGTGQHKGLLIRQYVTCYGIKTVIIMDVRFHPSVHMI